MERFKQFLHAAWERVKAMLFFIVLVMVFIGGYENEQNKPRAGDSCGESSHWVTVGTPLNPDLSCEDD